MWPFKKRIDPVSVRLSAHARNISLIYSRLSQHERFMNYELLELVHKLDKRVTDLEKILKSCNITITVVEKK